MCGFAGVYTLESGDHWERSLRAMADSLVHRGPDDQGTWHDRDCGVGLAHRRLSIVDLSAEGHQPMASACGRYVLALNGEIYNFRELRQTLSPNAHFRGNSDTEVLLAMISRHGIEAAIGLCVGMFAFAVWDREQRAFYLGRDRMGEKPLYYGWQGGSFLFASELRAMRAHPSWEGVISRDSLSLLLRHNYIPAPYSIYQGVYKVEPGTLIKLATPSEPSAEVEVRPYWSVRGAVEQGQREPFLGSDTEAVDELERLLFDSVGQQMLADVPVGAFLSGGVDSSATAAIMQASSSRRIRTFTIGFQEREFDESPHAEAVAKHLGTDHTTLIVSAKDALAVVPKLASIYDEPFSDSSQIPTFLVSQLARQSVTVSLSGDGGDETFCGYPRFMHTANLWKKLSRVPTLARQSARSLVQQCPPSFWKTIFDSPVVPAAIRKRALGDKVHALADRLCAPSLEHLYRETVSHWGGDPAKVVFGCTEPLTGLANPNCWPQQNIDLERMMFLDMISYLPGDILTKVDRAAMAVSLETRVPILDHRIIEFAWRLPLSMKVRGEQSKWILREVLYRHVPKQLIERPKVGFGIPLADWLRGPLRKWAEDQLSPSRIEREGFFDPLIVHERWQAHTSGTVNWHGWLWNILMFQVWLEEWH